MVTAPGALRYKEQKGEESRGEENKGEVKKKGRETPTRLVG